MVRLRLGCSIFVRIVFRVVARLSSYTEHPVPDAPKNISFSNFGGSRGLPKNGDSVLSEEVMKKLFHGDSRGISGSLTFIDTKVAAFRKQKNARGSASITNEAWMIVRDIVEMVDCTRTLISRTSLQS